MIEIERFLQGFTQRPPASAASIRECESKLSVKLPADFVEFLKTTNGCEGTIPCGSYIELWSAEQIASEKETHYLLQDCPGAIGFGTEEGHELFVFDRRSLGWSVAEIPMIGFGWRDATPLAASFNEFLERLHEFGPDSAGDKTLIEVTRTIFLLDGAYGIYAAEPWTRDSTTVVIRARMNSVTSICAQQEMAFFMTSGEAQEFLSRIRATNGLSVADQCDQLIEHARTMAAMR